MPRFVGGRGAIGAKLMIIGEAPDKIANEIGKCFAGPTGELVEKFLYDIGNPPVYMTNVRKYQPPFNNFKVFNPGEPPLEEQRKFLWEEIRSIKPNCILALGNNALRAVAGKDGINKWRGSILPSIEGIPKCVATFHPANLLRGGDSEEQGKGVFKYSYKYVIAHDFKRALGQSKFPELRLPERNLEVAQNSLQLYRFIERIYKVGRTSVDIEASRCIPICIALSAGIHEAISSPLFHRLNHINYEGITETELSYMWKAIADVLADPSIKKIGQNFKYDEDKIFRLGFKLDKLHSDTMLKAHVCNPEMPHKSLAFLGSIYTEEPYWKDEGKEFDPKRDKFDQLQKYNAKDSCVTEEIDLSLEEELNEKGLTDWYYRCMMPRHRFYLDMERVGFRVDETKREQLLEKYLKQYETTHDETTAQLGYELNVASNPQVTKCLYYDLKLPYRYKRKAPGDVSEKRTLVADEDTLVGLLANHAKTDKQQKVLENILDERKIRKTISTYILAKSDYDSRMRTSYNITGAETDRTSTSNISAPIRPEKSMGLGFQTLTKHGDIGADICEMFIPDDGYVFLNADLSQAEARVVFVLAEDYEILQQLDNPKFDIHWWTAKLFFHELPSVEECKFSLSKEDSRRFIGKTSRHSGHLGAGKHRYMETVNTDAKKYGINLRISEWRAGKYLDAFHEANPNIQKVFHKNIEEVLAKTRVLEGPSLIAPDSMSSIRGRWRMFFDRWSNEFIKQALAEIPQATVSNQTKFAGMRIKARLPDTQFILEGHDALLAQVPINEIEARARIWKEELERPIDFNCCSLPRNYQLVIPAEFQIGEKNYKDMEKFKI